MSAQGTFVARPMPFSVRAALGCPPHAELALSVAAEFSDVDLDRAERRLDTLARPLRNLEGADPSAQLAAVGRWVLGGFRPVRPTASGDELLLQRVLERRRGHVLTLALIAIEAGRRAGIDLGLVASEHVICVGHHALEGPLLLDPTRPNRLVDGHDLPGTLEWRCAHEGALGLIDALVESFTRRGDHERACAAAEMALSLPLSDDALERRGGAVERLRSRMN